MLKYEVFQSSLDGSQFEQLGFIFFSMTDYESVANRIPQPVKRFKFTPQRFAEVLARKKFPSARATYVRLVENI